MKLAAKIAFVLVVGISLVLAVTAHRQSQHDIDRFADDMREDALTVGRLFRPIVARVWRLEGEASAMYLLEYTNQALAADRIETKLKLRWVSLARAPDPDHRPHLPRSVLEPVARGKELTAVAVDDRGELRQWTYVPVIVGLTGEPPGALELSESMAPLGHYIAHRRRELVEATLAVAAICAVLVTVVGSWFVGRPVGRLTQVAERIGEGDLDARTDVRQRDELGTLARVMNDMAARLAAARERLSRETDRRIATLDQLRHADRLSSVGRLAAGIAHELGTPLAVISGRAKLIADGTVGGAETIEYARSMARQSDKMATIIRQLLDFARQRQVHLKRRTLSTVLDQTLVLLRPLASKRGVTLELDAPEGGPEVAADPVGLQQVFTNLIVNALDALPRGGTVTLSVGVERARPPGAGANATEDDYAVCHVIDDGDGISPEVLPKIFEPFFTTKAVGKGTGLGLAVSYGIVSEHHGWIAASSTPEQGTRFSVYLPRA